MRFAFLVEQWPWGRGVYRRWWTGRGQECGVWGGALKRSLKEGRDLSLCKCDLDFFNLRNPRNTCSSQENRIGPKLALSTEKRPVGMPVRNAGRNAGRNVGRNVAKFFFRFIQKPQVGLLGIPMTVILGAITTVSLENAIHTSCKVHLT